ncbi:ABC-type antimicrobial peptide transport system permease subunit [Roseivirga pacifica]|uniref:ABC-type antimicrobial peptide transport system, permease component n=1 Tax=Roseivirga pacifica TaxID=1267423 RepID=A0A1I0NZ66_9BACT|nr:FtsX-like permease family protein [Roseivirga pacifica]RKQ51536.1 ABC-type antimicrobial peptide transport system permease subunit [Roseivirga pacifica]SEW06457.1 ABC-type antimicrobial peptide transport system, permease component [Roseivirga pacifica]
MESNQTPRFWSKLFKWFCNDSLYEELQGDLEEAYINNTNTRGAKKARSIYRKEVLRMIRPSVTKKTKLPHMISQAFIFHYFKVSFRNLKKHFAYSILNVLGFAAALAVCLFCINAIYSNHQLDQKFTDKERIYRVSLKINDQFGPNLSAKSQIPLANKLETTLPEIESLGLIQMQGEPMSAYLLKGQRVTFKVDKVNEDFFKVFDYEMILGNVNDLFANPSNIIITKSMMDKYFTPETVIGKKLGKYIISGVIEDPSKVSHIDFEILNSQYKDHTASSYYTSWNSYYFQQLYIKLQPNTSHELVSEKLHSMAAEVNEELKGNKQNATYDFVLEPLTSLAQSDASFNNAVLLNSNAQKAAKILIVVLLAIAAFNYTNLAMAGALSRTKEVGVRKVMGSKRTQLIIQFLIETTLLTLFGFVFGLLIFWLLAPSFASFSDFTFQTTLSFGQVAIFFGFALGVAFISGLIPGLFFSRISVLGLFKTNVSQRKLSLQTLKKGLIVFQVSLSLLVFTLGFILLNQAHLINKQKSPFTGENIVAIEQPSSDSLGIVFHHNLNKISGVESVTSLSQVPFGTDAPSYRLEKHHLENKEKFESVRILQADSGIISIFKDQIEWHSGNDYKNEKAYFLVNKAFEEQISDSLKNYREGSYSIGTDFFPVFGTIDNLNLGDPISETRPSAILVYNAHRYSTLLIKLNNTSFKNTLSEIEAMFQNSFPEESFFPLFLDDILYNRLRQFRSIVRSFIFIFSAIIAITLMGQIGMAMYSAQTKEKEIGIRKVLGASFKQITSLLLKGTYVQLLIAGLIACPLAYYIFNELKPDFTVPLQVQFYHLLAAFISFALLIIALVTSQTWKTSNANPSEILRNE